MACPSRRSWKTRSNRAGEGVITAVEPQQRRSGRRSNVFVDGRFAFSLSSDLAAGLRVGQSMSADEVTELLGSEEAARCYDAALRFLAVRSRSEQEVRQRLARHGYPSELVDGAIDKLRRVGLIDDAAFARYWVEQRQTHRPRGSRLLKLELRQKGVGAEEVGAAVADLPQEDAAYQAASARVRSLRGLDERTFRQRLGGYLQRRGFDYETAASAVSRLWQETRERGPEIGEGSEMG